MQGRPLTRRPFLILRGGRRQLDALDRLVRPLCLSRQDALRRLDRAPGPIVEQNVGQAENARRPGPISSTITSRDFSARS